MDRRGVAALLVCLAAVVPYLSTVDDYFTQDDFGVVALLSQKPASSFPGWFATTWMDDIWGYTPDEIRPFPAVTYQVAAWWGAASPVANHVINIAFHAANALLVLAIGGAAAGLSLPAAALAAIVFALLPAHPETVAWVTGRVDSMPALFYLAAFLAYVRWRGTGASRFYVASLLLFFVALFSKQNTITLAAALVLYDLVVAGRGVRLTSGWVRPYVPFVVLTAGYLLLRYLVFGEVARESQLADQNVDDVVQLTGRHLRRIVAGQVLPFDRIAAPLAVALAMVGAASVVTGVSRRRTARAGVYFVLVWTILGIAPTFVAGYESPRHIYLAAVGWALGVGLAADVLWHARPRRIAQPIALVTAVLLLVAYGMQLRSAVRGWNVRAAVSLQAVVDLEREALAAPEGSLIIAGAAVRSWEWALPFAARPPYARVDLTSRVNIISPMLLHCCRGQWHGHARETLERWARHPDSPPVIALYWDPDTAALSRLTSREEPFLRALMTALMKTPGEQALQRGLSGAIATAVLGRAR